MDEAKANGTFDASNPDIRYSLATDMARDAVMTALEGAGIDVEMATPEMVEDVLRARDAEFMSAKKRRALETVSSQDEYQQTVVSSADGAKVLKNLDSLAKEYQENVLSGNFNDVTLQKINQYIDETTPRNPYGRRLSQRLPQRVEREMYEKQRENAVDALYSRISESSVPANGRFSESGRREIESRKKEALKGWAIATGNWHTDLSAFTNQTEPIGVGTDSKVYVSKDGKHVIKASKGKPYGKRFRPNIDNILYLKMFLWYVPMKGNADVEAEDIYTYVNDKSSSFTPTVKRAKGHTKYVSEDVMALIANTMQSAILQGERNKVKQKFLNMVQNYPTDLFSVDNGWVELQGNDWVEVFPDINENDTPEEVRSILPHQFYNLQIFYILLIDYKTNNRSLIMPTLLPGCSRIYVQ